MAPPPSTAAAGNDSRITGAAQTANNLSDLVSASTARSNLGLGVAATQSVAGVVAAGLLYSDGTNPGVNPVSIGSGLAVSGGALRNAGALSVAGRAGAVTLSHADLTDWSSATSGFLTSAVASLGGMTGAVTCGTNITCSGGTISASGGTYTLPAATSSTLGGVTVSTGLSVSGGALSVAYGTTSGTAAQGNDSRIIGALQSSALPSQSTGTIYCAQCGRRGGDIHHARAAVRHHRPGKSPAQQYDRRHAGGGDPGNRLADLVHRRGWRRHISSGTTTLTRDECYRRSP